MEVLGHTDREEGVTVEEDRGLKGSCVCEANCSCRSSDQTCRNRPSFTRVSTDEHPTTRTNAFMQCCKTNFSRHASGYIYYIFALVLKSNTSLSYLRGPNLCFKVLISNVVIIALFNIIRRYTC